MDRNNRSIWNFSWGMKENICVGCLPAEIRTAELPEMKYFHQSTGTFRHTKKKSRKSNFKLVTWHSCTSIRVVWN
jgi:hypothetical protein